MSNQVSKYCALPEDIAVIFCEALRGIDGVRVHPSCRDNEAMCTTTAVCRAWNGDLVFNAAKIVARMQNQQQERLKAVHLHLQNLNQLVRKIGHTFQVSAAPYFFRNFERTERELDRAWSGADWTVMQYRLDHLD